MYPSLASEVKQYSKQCIADFDVLKSELMKDSLQSIHLHKIICSIKVDNMDVVECTFPYFSLHKSHFSIEYNIQQQELSQRKCQGMSGLWKDKAR